LLPSPTNVHLLIRVDRRFMSLDNVIDQPLHDRDCTVKPRRNELIDMNVLSYPGILPARQEVCLEVTYYFLCDRKYHEKALCPIIDRMTAAQRWTPSPNCVIDPSSFGFSDPSAVAASMSMYKASSTFHHAVNPLR
jgi:hypothetical protein